ncbi:MAG: hypothetical protein JW741_04550 [Sedimentisphaerales bacterium]|nr:hypothetical protein [Sedimentisphaerales bacterium]
MRKLVLAAILVCVVHVIPAAAEASQGAALSADTLARALDSGCSLVIAEILSVRSESRMYYYRVRVARAIIVGDLKKQEVQKPVELFAGASYGDALKTGRYYALLVARDYPHAFSWAFRDDVMEVNPWDEMAVRRLTELADRIYAQTSILQFRRARVEYNVELPPLPDELTSLCEAFRNSPGRRTEIGRKIFDSDLGSRIDRSNPESSIRRYLPPKISCSRAQVLSLFGHPTWKNGWSCFWCCDYHTRAQGGSEQIAVLSATFDKDERAIRVLYHMHDRSKWIRRPTIAERVAEQEGDPAGVARAFQQALRGSDWDQALSLCRQAVKDAARRHDSAGAFFRSTVPVRDVVSREFNPHMFSSRDGKTTRMSDEVNLDAGEDHRGLRWTWGLIRAGRTWQVDFAPIPLERFIQKERVKREFQEAGPRTDEEAFDRSIRYVLVPIGDEFTLGEPMLFRLEMRNVGDVPVAFYHSQVMLGDPVIVTDPKGRRLSYADTDYQTDLWPDAILPGETIVLADRYDVTLQYRILRPGPYTFQFKRGDRRSNVCTVEVKPGPVPEREQIVEKFLPVLPAGWKWCRSLRSPPGFKEDGPVESLYIRFSGKPGGKGNRYGLTLLVLMGGDPIDTDPWLKEWFDFWGHSPWGPVYAWVNEVESLWPTYRPDIARVLRIKPPEIRSGPRR